MDEIHLIIEPDEAENEVAAIIVQGKVNGKNYRFHLDTGAAKTTIINDEYISKFNSLEVSKSNGLFLQNFVEESVLVPKIELGPIKTAPFLLSRVSDNNIIARNLIGMDLLKDYRFQINFDKNKLIIDSNELNIKHQNLLLGKRFQPYIDVSINNQLGKALLDTGAGITLVDLKFIEENPNCFVEKGISSVTDTSGISQETPMYLMKSLIIDNRVFPQHKAVGIDLSPLNSATNIPIVMVLGYSTLSKANWVIDFPNKKWGVENMNYK